MIEVELTEHQVAILFSAFKQAETLYVQEQKWKASNEVSKLHGELHKQIYTYGQLEEDN
jgi:hypothetical protein